MKHTRPRLSALALLALTALAAPVAAQRVELTDDRGRTIALPAPAKRIVSLAPHVTEMLFAAGAGERVVGAVDYSDYPAAAKALPRVGGYTRIDLEAVATLRPDLVIGWHSGNRESDVDRLQALGLPVYLSEPRNLEDVARGLEQLGRLAGTTPTADAAASTFRTRRNQLAALHAGRAPVRVFYQIWERPLITINDEHLIADVIRLCGGRNVFGAIAHLTPTIGTEAVLAANPEAIVASGMDAARPEWLDQWARWPQLDAARRGNLFFIPPELIQRHTPRILDGAQRLCEQLDVARARQADAVAADITPRPDRPADPRQ